MNNMISFIRSSSAIHTAGLRKTKRILFTLICLSLLLFGSSDLVPRAHAASAMTASESCVEFIKAVEGFSAVPYYDYSQYTVGYGTRCPSEKLFYYKANGISRQDAEALLRAEISEIEDTLNQKFIDLYNLSLSQHQFDALVSFSFNIGTGWISYDSSLRNAILNNADSGEMTYAFGLYCTAGGKYLPGLVTRRLCEANMYLNGVYSKNMSSDFGYVYYDANGGTVEYRVQGFLCAGSPVPAADAVRDGDVFLGWYTDLQGGTKVDTLTGALTGRTLFARWQSSENGLGQSITSTTVKVTGDAVNIRSGPGTNYGIIKRVYRNDTVTVSHVTHLTNMKWGKIQDGWICLDYTNYDAVISGSSNPLPETPSGGTSSGSSTWWDDVGTDWNTAPDSTAAVTGTVRVNDRLIIRGGAGTTYPSVGYLYNGNRVEILEQCTVGSRTWGRISKGWVCMDYITTDGSSTDWGSDQKPADSTGTPEAISLKGKITADVLRIRSGAGTANSIVGFYYQNDVVIVSEKVRIGSSDWGKTDRGWISMDYVSAVSSDDTSSQPAGNSKMTVRADCLRIRQDAGTNHKIMGFLYDGDTVTILETKTVNGTSWGRINQGWICMTYVK